VQDVEIAFLISLTIAALILLVTRLAPGAPGRGTRALLGLVPGLLGAFVVLAVSTDLVPDSLERRALPVVVIAVTVGIVLITITSLLER
jgi:hypothetical protein